MNEVRQVVVIRSNNLAFLPDADEMYLCYRSYSFFARALRKIVKKIGLRCAISIFYGKWKKQINNCNLMIIFDGGVDNVDLITSYIKRINPNLRLIFWYWNPVKKNDVALDNKFIDEIWTYDRFDAKRYNLKYNLQFYNRVSGIKKTGENIGLIFMGADKGRKQLLDYIEKNAMNQGLKCNFRIVKSKKERVDYKDYLSMIANAKCVVDIVPGQNCGLTLRPLEALFYEKKLITNYEDIVNYDFYNKENIFIIGKDDMNRLAEFVDGPYKKINKKIVDFYSYENWLKRIERNESIEP